MKKVLQGLVGVLVLGSVINASAQTKFPLRVDIDVSAKRSRNQVGAGEEGEFKVEQVQVRVKVRKSGGQPWTDPVHAELYVIGKQVQTGYYGIIDVIKKEFTFTKENDQTFEFTSGSYRLPSTSGNIGVGGTYETYLVVITDNEGTIIDTRSGRHIKDEGIAFIRELGPLTLFDRDGNVIGKVDPSKSPLAPAIQSATAPGKD